MKLITSIVIAALAVISPANAALFSFDFRGDNVTAEQDADYFEKYKLPGGSSLDTTSRIYTSKSTYDDTQPDSPTPGLVATLAGRSYDGDPVHGTDWGLLDQSSIDFTERPDSFSNFLVKYGIRPSGIGSTESVLKDAQGNFAKASYLEFKISSDSDVLFDELSIQVTDLVAIEPTDVAWASTSADELGAPVVPISERDATGEKESLTFTWKDLALNQSSDQSVTVKIYGLKGADYGNFKNATISGRITPPQAVPEASAAIMSLFGLFGIMLRRHRK